MSECQILMTYVLVGWIAEYDWLLTDLNITELEIRSSWRMDTNDRRGQTLGFSMRLMIVAHVWRIINKI